MSDTRLSNPSPASTHKRSRAVRLTLLGLSAAGLLLAGCANKTETGYEPQKLGMSDAQRRGLYASPFSPEAIDAGMHHQGDPSTPKPKSNLMGEQ